jgi:sec-independent protein translocase protein TatB
MFGLGPTELIVILVLALLVLGPQRIPEAASSLGKAIRSFRRATRDLRDQIDIDDDVRRPFEDLRSALRDEPAPLPPPTNPLNSASIAGAAAGIGSSSLVQPPAEPVLSQTGDGATDGPQTAMANPEVAVSAPEVAVAATAAPSPGAPVLALATSSQTDGLTSKSGGTSSGPASHPESHK